MSSKPLHGMEQEVLKRINTVRKNKGETLDLSNCSLNALPDAFNWEPKEKVYLSFIDLSRNNISDLETLKALSGFKNLKSLRLSSNKIVNVTPLQGLKSLEVLELGNNLLAKCPEKDCFPLLKECDLNGNPIDVGDILAFYFKFKPVKVFISYNHQDYAQAKDIQDFLNLKNIEVIIDQTNLNVNGDIGKFIEDGIENANYTLSIISEKSLLSSWVAIESLKLSEMERSLHESKWLPFAIDQRFHEISFVRECTKSVKSRIMEIGNEIRQRIEEDMEFHDIADEYHRLYKLKHNLPETVQKIKSRLYVDATTPEKLPTALEKVYKAIKESESKLRNVKDESIS